MRFNSKSLLKGMSSTVERLIDECWSSSSTSSVKHIKVRETTNNKANGVIKDRFKEFTSPKINKIGEA